MNKEKLFDKIKNGNHPRFIHNVEKNQVECRCGHVAIWWKTGYICGTITAYPCKYNKQIELIGYQIVSNNGKNEMPDCFSSFEVIEDAYVAEKWLIMEKVNPEHGNFRWCLHPVFSDDIEEPTFINCI